MCIIIYKPEGAALPRKKELRRLFASNPDGAGFMYRDGGAVVIRKGFMTFDGLYRALPRGAGDLVVHMRIATHGGVNPRFCHPFPLSTSLKKLTRLEARADIGIAHNGVISLTGSASDMSDTMAFIREYAAPLVAAVGLTDWSARFMEAAVDSSRLAIMDAASTGVTLLGKWYEHDGCFYSNTGYRSTPLYSRSDYLRGYYAGYYDTDGYAGRWSTASTKQPRACDYSAITAGLSIDDETGGIY